MSLQEMPCLESGLYFYGCFKLMEYSMQIEMYLDNFFAEYFNSPAANWEQIREVFDWGGTSSLIANGGPSKHEDQGDGSKTSWSSPLSGDRGCLVQAYRIADKLGIIKSGVDLEITFCWNFKDEISKVEIWKSLAKQYEVIKEIHLSMIMLSFAMQPLYQSNNILNRSPAQMTMYMGFLPKTSITMSSQFGGSVGTSSLHRIPWDKNDSLFSSMIGALKGDWITTLIAESPISITYTDPSPVLHYTITTGDVSAERFTIPATNLLHPIMMVKLPSLPEELDPIPDPAPDPWPMLPPDPNTPDCYGISFGTDPSTAPTTCDACDYLSFCGNPTFIDPLNIDTSSNTIINYIGTADDMFRIKYKQAI